jgi:dihydroorotate dehydrogenase (NAD+) catalytic subunit
MNLSVSIGSLTLANPLIAASGCFGYGVEYVDVVYLASLGGVAVKGLFLKEREGHPPQRIVETPAGMLNAIGLGSGVHRFVREKLPELRDRRAVVFVSICRTTIDECEIAGFCRIMRRRRDRLNISVRTSRAASFGCSLNGTHDVVSAVRKVTSLPVIPKLTPNVTNVASFARAAEEAGADAVSLVNAFLAMAIDVHTRRPKLTNIVGGSAGRHPSDSGSHGNAVPTGLKTAHHRDGRHRDNRRRAPVLIAGATAVQIGTANFVDLPLEEDPRQSPSLHDDTPR